MPIKVKARGGIVVEVDSAEEAAKVADALYWQQQNSDHSDEPGLSKNAKTDGEGDTRRGQLGRVRRGTGAAGWTAATAAALYKKLPYKSALMVRALARSKTGRLGALALASAMKADGTQGIGRAVGVVRNKAPDKLPAPVDYFREPDGERYAVLHGGFQRALHAAVDEGLVRV